MYQDDDPLVVVSREEWGAQKAEEGIPLVTPVPHVIHTFTGTDICFNKKQCMEIVREIQSQDMAKKLGDIKYNFVIGGEGTVFMGRGWELLPALNPVHSDLWETSIEIAHIGPAGFPPDCVIESAQKLIKRGILSGYVIERVKYVMEFEKNADSDFRREKRSMLKDRMFRYE